MRVLVTGADGFVGPHLVRHLRASGHEPLPLRGPGADSAAGPVLDVLDGGAVREAFASFAPDAIVNLAGVSSIAQSHANPSEAFRVIVLGAVNLCVAAVEAAPNARLLLVGSGEMYGPTADGARSSETDPLLPKSPYAAAKVGAEVAALTFRRCHGLDVVLVRPFNHVGRGQRPDFAVPAFARQIEAIRASRAPGVISVGNLSPIRDFLHVEDVVAAYRLLLERGVAGEAYNVCSGDGRTIRSVLDELVSMAGVEARIEVAAARVRPIDVPNLVGDPSRMEALGWARRHTVREALADVLAEARAQMDRGG